MIPRLKMSGVQKAFGATRALKSVSFTVAPGEVHALIGENGAGKSTLMKILSGAYRADAGNIEIDGQPFQPENPHHARRSGIAMIYQELTLAPHLSVEENILLGAEPAKLGWLNRSKRRELARRALAELHNEDISPSATVGALSVAQKQIVEIARALISEPKVLVMDEPTSSLTQVDTENLFRVINRLRKRGVSVVYISHFLEECQRLCQRYTVLRDGESVTTGEMLGASATSEETTSAPAQRAQLTEIIRAMVGRELSEIYPHTPHQLGESVLELKSISADPKPRSVSFTLRKGEILGIAGLVGAGRTETLRAAFGLDRIRDGAVVISGRECTHGTPADRLRDGIGLLSENRKEEGLMLNRSLADNLTVTNFSPVASAGFVSVKRQRQVTQQWMTRLQVRARDASQSIAELSGGNQQKIAIGRLLHHDAKIFLLDEPTRGIDVGSKAQIYRLIGELAAQGKSVVFVSSYLPELLGVCDTIAVMCRGVLSEVKPVSAWTEHSLIAAAVGTEELSNA
jgi:ribose transport system ATP-binding protein